MNVDEFREGMEASRRREALFIVTDGAENFIAVGLDSKRKVAILHMHGERPLADLSVAIPDPHKWLAATQATQG